MKKTEKKVPVLFSRKGDCCGCGACAAACPMQAIAMVEDPFGFLYPVIDEEKCICCGKCKKVCGFQSWQVSNTPLRTYAAVSEDRGQSAQSASGGVFAAMASQVLERGGLVCGAAYDADWTVRHELIAQPRELVRLQGSKYTHSHTRDAYTAVKAALEQGKTVLFSGTPCQISGLYGYLGGDRENLITVDIVCHGVPSGRFFREFVHSLERENSAEAVAFSFRDKKLGWGKNGSITLKKQGKTYKKYLWENENSYFYYFAQGALSRENCQSCPYACSARPADVTLGDYWGIEKAHPDYLRREPMSDAVGISVVVANTEKGIAALERYGHGLCLHESTFEKAAAGNHRLRSAAGSDRREAVLQEYAQGGWDAVEARFRKKIGWRRYTSRLKAMLPTPAKRFLKRLR